MTSRREFLEAAALSALPVVAGVSLSGAAAAASRPAGAGSLVSASPSAASASEFHLVLFDARYSDARSAAARIAGAGAATHSLADGDITQVWLDHIGPAWQRGPAVIAGVTARPALFCLEQFALSSGLRVVFHAEHVVHADGRAEHTVLRGAERVGLSAVELANSGARWAGRVGEAIASYRAEPSAPRFGRSNAALEPVLPPRAQLLTSWIIAAA
jgi:hypothetical protein